MIHTAASALAYQWAKNSVIPEADREAYQYGLELLLSTAVNLVLMIGLSAVTGHLWQFIPYLAAFVPLRLAVGGYHAKHHLSCILFNMLVYLAALITVDLLTMPLANTLCVMESIVSFAVIFLFAPVPARNKALSDKERRRNRYISLVLSILLLILCALFYCAHLFTFTCCKMLFFGQASATILLIIEKIGLLAFSLKQSKTGKGKET